MNVAVIPARGGSKRIPRKNIRMFAGRPMIGHSIEIARTSGLFDRIIVSTEDEEIARTASDLGAEVPFMRPVELADDFADTTSVIAHAARWLQGEQVFVKAICCIYATAPFLLREDLKKGLAALDAGSWSYALPVTDFASPIFRAFQQRPGGGLEMFFPEKFVARSQDLPVAFHDAGQFYWGKPESWLNQERLFGPHTFPIIVPRWRVQDIDSEADWYRAELLWQLLDRSRDA